MAPHDQIRALYAKLDERAQLSLLIDLIQGSDNLNRSDGFIDALMPVDAAFGDAFADLDNAADDAFFTDTRPSFGMQHPDSPSFGAGL